MVVATVEKVPAPKNKAGKHGHAVKRQHGFWIAVLPAANGAERGAFIKTNVATKSHLLTDGFKGYQGQDATRGDYLKHTPVIQNSGANAAEFFPIIHTIFSNIKAWLVGTHHGVSAKHLPRYLREWAYRSNRCNLPDGPANNPRGTHHRARIFAPQPCIRWTSDGPNHDAAMRIDGEVPRRQLHSQVRHESHWPNRRATTPDRYRQPVTA